MPEPGSDDVVVRLRAQVDQLQKDLDNAQNQLKEFGDKAQSGFAEIGKTLSQAFAAEKVFEFIKEGVLAFAEYERALDNLGKKVTAAGGNWKDLRGSVEDYAKGIALATRFSETDVIKSLDKLMLKTNDYSASLKLNERAMNLAVLANIPLEEAAQELGLAYEGNQRGLLMLGRQLGLTSKEAHNAQEVFDLLDKRSQGLARSEDNLATNLDKAKHSIELTAKTIGEALAPAVTYLARLFSEGLEKAIGFVIKTAQSFGATIGTEILIAINWVHLWSDSLVALAEFMVHVWKHPLDAWQQLHKDMDAAHKKFFASVEQIDEAGAESIAEIWDNTAKKKNAIDLKELNQRIIVKSQEKDLQEHFGKSEVDFFQANQQKKRTLFEVFEKGITDTHKIYTQIRGETDADYAARVKEDQHQIEQEAQNSFQRIAALAHQMAADLSNTGKQWVKEYVAHTLTLAKAFKELAQSILRSMIKAIGETLIQEGEAKIAEAVAAMLGIVTAAGAPGLFAAGASLAAAGGTIVGLSESIKLATGGIVTKPMHALIGEAGPEAVIPLGGRGAGALGGTTSFHGTQMVFPGVRNASDLQGARFQQTAERVLADTWQRMNQRKGIKVPA